MNRGNAVPLRRRWIVSLEPIEATLPVARPIQVEHPVLAVETPAAPMPTEEQARLAGQVFAQPAQEQNALIDGVWLAAAGMLVHDVVKDTLAASEEDEEEEEPGKLPKPKRQ
jgi:hypothetical protein